MRKKHTIILIGVILILVVILVTRNFFTQQKPKKLMEYFFSTAQEQVQAQIRELYNTYNDEVKVDDYIITLKESVVESELPKGYCVFEVRRKNHDMRKNEFLPDLLGSYFGEDSRFTFYFSRKDIGGMNDKCKFYATKDVLYVYLEFSLLPTDKEFELYLYDSKSGKEYKEYPENSIGKFKLKKDKMKKSYKYEDTDIVITPFRILINSDNWVAANNLELLYEDGTDIVVIDGSIEEVNNVKSNSHGDQGTEYEEEYPGYKKRYYYDLILKKAIDINGLKSIRFNGKVIG